MHHVLAYHSPQLMHTEMHRVFTRHKSTVSCMGAAFCGSLDVARDKYRYTNVLYICQASPMIKGYAIL